MTVTRLAGALPRALALLFALLVLAGVPSLAPAAPARAAEEPDVTADVVRIAPTVVGPEDTQDVTVRVTNSGTTARTGLQAELGVGWQVVATRGAVASWADADASRRSSGQLGLPVDDLPPGESADVTFELDVASLQLGDDAPWGPRRLSVTIADGTGTLAVLHTFMLYDPDGGTSDAGRTAPTPVSLTVAAPLTGPALDPADPEAYDDTVAQRTAEDGEYARLLTAATTGSRALSLAVDPAVVASASTGTDDTASTWAAELERDGAADVVVLPPYDVDLAALAHADTRPRDVAAVTDGSAILDDWEVPSAWSTQVAWPAGTTDLPTLTTAAGAGLQPVVATDGLRPDDAATTTGLVATDEGDVPVVLADPTLSAAVTSTRTAGTAAATLQEVLADTAVLAAQAEEDGASAGLLAALPRGWSPDVDTFEAVMSGVAAQSWVDLTPLSTLATDPGTGSVTAVDLAQDDDELGPGAVRRLTSTRDDLASFATVATDPSDLTGEVDRALTVPLSVAYRSAPEARDAAIGLATEQANQVRTGISVVDRADVTLISDSGNLPVRIRNDLPADATVTVSLSPDDPRLVVETAPTLVVPAGESRDAEVRVRAIGSGDVTLGIEVTAPSGVVVAAPADFTVKVRAGWETVGTAVIAAGVGLLFVVGIWRTVRRGRSDRRTTGEQVADAAVPTGAQHDAPSPDDPEEPAP
ncbi:DUF6049 family protein [Isoptericola jiangsuensis]|uniref:DUF6049 family protein n=1 Tax=Isoptericola jiangsuensis TaxID=548579 RepID=UPI003AAD14F7